MHFHRTGDNAESFVQDCAFYRSFYRCVTIHETNKVTVSENVAFDITGMIRLAGCAPAAKHAIFAFCVAARSVQWCVQGPACMCSLAQRRTTTLKGVIFCTLRCVQKSAVFRLFYMLDVLELALPQTMMAAQTMQANGICYIQVVWLCCRNLVMYVHTIGRPAAGSSQVCTGPCSVLSSAPP